jgi:hypothetical protein
VKKEFVAVAFATLTYIRMADAQGYPSRYITIIVPFTAGSPVDTISRILAPRVSRALGQQVVVENVTGAGGTTGITRAAKAAPDGYTIVIASTGTHAGARPFIRISDTILPTVSRALVSSAQRRSLWWPARTFHRTHCKNSLRICARTRKR